MLVPPLFGLWRFEMTRARWTDALVITAVTIMATLGGGARGGPDPPAALPPAAPAGNARGGAEIDRPQAPNPARPAAPPGNQRPQNQPPEHPRVHDKAPPAN